MKQVILVLCILNGTHIAAAQDSIPLSQRRNTIRLDVTSYWLYRNSFVLGYERITKPNESLAITVGYQEFPRASSLGEGIFVKDDRKRNGYKFGAEYRFYLKRENKFPAPRGVFIGPYFTYLGFNNERTIEVDNNGTSEEAMLESKLKIFNVGIQLGYQFVFNNRWTIDLVLIGPSISHYGYKLDINGNNTFDKEDIENEIILDLIDRFPLLDDVISDKEATAKGRLDTWAYGYRYLVGIGYHFGRK